MGDDGVDGLAYDYDFGEEHGTLLVDAYCPKCHRFISHKGAHVSVNGLGETSVSGFHCNRCGDVTPNYEWA